MARGEIYAQVSCDYYDNAKMIRAGEKAEILYVRSLCLSNRLLLDGKILPEHLIAMRFERDGMQRAAKLVEVGLWRALDDGWEIIGWRERNRSRMEIMEIRERERERKKEERIAARAARAGGSPRGNGPFDADVSGGCPAGQSPDSGWTNAGRGADVRSDSASQRSTNNEQRSSTNAHRSASDEVNYAGKSLSRPQDGSAPRLRQGEPAPLTTSLAGLLGRIG